MSRIGTGCSYVAYWILLPTLFAAAALDAGRFRWSEMPAAVQAVGRRAASDCGVHCHLVVHGCESISYRRTRGSRAERGQRVVQHGPYRFVRHPMYMSLIVLMIGMALILGSWLALVPASLDRCFARDPDIARRSPAHNRTRRLSSSTRITFTSVCYLVCGNDRNRTDGHAGSSTAERSCRFPLTTLASSAVSGRVHPTPGITDAGHCRTVPNDRSIPAGSERKTQMKRQFILTICVVCVICGPLCASASIDGHAQSA